MLVWDIETGPIDDVALAAACPAFEPPVHPGEFNAADVKTGNLKDQSKIDAKIAEAKSAHETAVANHSNTCTALAEQHFAEFKSKAALDATTGCVLAIGFWSVEKEQAAIIDGKGDEATLLAEFWGQYAKCRKQSGGPRKLVGWNIFGFDLPFLVKRSWFHGVEVPQTIRDQNDRYWDSLFVDLMLRFSVGQWNGKAKLDTAAQFLSVGKKPDGVGGADFARLWFGTPEEKHEAIAYLRNDLAMTAGVARRLGIA